MISLLGFLGKNPRKKETLLTYYYSAKFRLQLLLLPMERLHKGWGTRDLESPWAEPVETYRQAAVISKIVNRVCDRTPWQSKCLVRALAAQRLLYRRGIPTTLYMGCGVEEGKMVAHAWLRCGKIYVTGGDGSGYTTVARFCLETGRKGESHVGNMGNCGSARRADA